MRSDPLHAVAQSNRRRLLVFLGTLAVALAVSLVFTWLRQPEYRASARVEITPAIGSVIARPAPSGAPESDRAFLTEVQVLTSRPVLGSAAAKLEHAGRPLSAFGPDPVAGMQADLEALPVSGTNVVELVATGSDPQQLAPLLSAVIDAYQERLSAAYLSSSGDAMAQADEEVRKLEGSVAAMRREVEAFRIRNNIVSLERDENEVLARVRNLSTSLMTANDRVAAAEGKVRALEAAAAAGKTAVRARDDPTLANLEQRASQMREELRDLERAFTQDYLAKDPKVIAQRARLAELERQITAQRAAGQQMALVEAHEELASAEAASARIQSQMSGSRQEVAQFTARFNEYKARQDQLGELETAYRDAIQRRAKLEATERARMPATKLLEAASTPTQPWRPFYWRDSAFSVGGSLMLALLAMWLVELFNRTGPQPSVLLIQPQPGGALPLQMMTPQMLFAARTPAMPLEAVEPALLPRQAKLPRELRGDEVAALVHAADPDSRLAILLFLSGVSPEEALKLRQSDVDLARGAIRVGGGREITLCDALQRCLEVGSEPGSEFILGAPGRPATRDSLDARILCAAHDAGIEEPTGVNAECLRHTYIAFLVRQGIRFADLTHVVGDLPVEIVGAYSALLPPGARVAGAAIEVLHPALR